MLDLACWECGDDLATEGWAYCSACLEGGGLDEAEPLDDEADADLRPPTSVDARP